MNVPLLLCNGADFGELSQLGHHGLLRENQRSRFVLSILGMFHVTSKELYLYVSEVTPDSWEAMAVGGRVTGLQQLAAFHLKREGIH